MQELMMFENNQVEVMEVDGVLYFELYSTGMALGQVVTAKGKKYPNKDRIDRNVESAEISTVLHNAKQYITEEQLYDLMLEMKTDKVKPFRKWVTSEVLPSIRKTGSYTAPNKDVSKALAEFRGQVATLVNDIFDKKMEDVREYYKINSKSKVDISTYIKKRLGITKSDEEYEAVKTRVFLLLNINKWEDLDIDSYKEIMPIVDESIRVIKLDRPQQTSLFDKE